MSIVGWYLFVCWNFSGRKQVTEFQVSNVKLLCRNCILMSVVIIFILYKRNRKRCNLKHNFADNVTKECEK